MRYLKTIERKVRTILAKNEDARNDDMVLYLVLCNACLKDAGALPLAEIMTQYKWKTATRKVHSSIKAGSRAKGIRQGFLPVGLVRNIQRRPIMPSGRNRMGFTILP